MDDVWLMLATAIFIFGFVSGYVTREKISRDRRRRFKRLE
jgi:hypothetical protein